MIQALVLSSLRNPKHIPPMTRVSHRASFRAPKAPSELSPWGCTGPCWVELGKCVPCQVWARGPSCPAESCAPPEWLAVCSVVSCRGLAVRRSAYLSDFLIHSQGSPQLVSKHGKKLAVGLQGLWTEGECSVLPICPHPSPSVPTIPAALPGTLRLLGGPTWWEPGGVDRPASAPFSGFGTGLHSGGFPC